MLNENLNHQLSMFDYQHLIVLSFFIIVIVLFYIFKDKISSKQFETRFRISLALFLLIFETLFHIWILSRGSYSLSMIPFTGYCAFVNLLTIITLLLNKPKWFNYLIYYALTGAFFSLVFVDMSFAFPHFRFFHYFLVHFGFLLASLYYYFTNKIEINYKNLFISTSFVFGYTIIILIVDLIFNQNWFYLFVNPVEEISAFFKVPWYTILWIIANIIFTLIWFSLLKVLYDKKIKKMP